MEQGWTFIVTITSGRAACQLGLLPAVRCVLWRYGYAVPPLVCLL